MAIVGCRAEVQKLIEVSNEDVGVIEDSLKQMMDSGVPRKTAQVRAVESALALLAEERDLVEQAVADQLLPQVAADMAASQSTNDLDNFEFMGPVRVPGAVRHSKREYEEVVAKYKGTDQWMKAPNGAKTKLTERQWVQTRTPAFKAWFGDWEKHATAENPEGSLWSDEGVSKAVDAETREPKVLFHGSTNGGFMRFRQPGGEKRGDIGIFLTDNYDMARSYVRKNRYKDIEAPVLREQAEEAGVDFYEYQGRASSRETEDRTLYGYTTPYGDEVDGFESMDAAVADAADEYVDASEVPEQPGIYALFLNLRQPEEAHFEGALWNGSRDHQWIVEVGGEQQFDADGVGYFSSKEEAEEFAASFLAPDDEENNVVALDYVRAADDRGESTDDVARSGVKNGDGAIIHEVIDDGGGPGAYNMEPATVYVAANPEQLKSADWNTGDFSARTADLRYSQRTKQDKEAKAAKTAQESAVGDKTDIAQLPAGREIPDSVAVGGLESSFALARGKSYARGRDLKVDIQNAVLAAAKQARVNLTKRTKALHAFLSDMVFKDAMYALKTNENAIGWYDQKVSRAIGAISVIHPEINTSKESRLAFLWALAVTSNGLKVDKNFELAESAYRRWKDSSEDLSKRVMPTDVGIGNAAKGINDGLGMFNELVGMLGYETAAKFMATEFPAGDITRMLGIEVGGEWKGTPVRGAAILGPKIGNGFYMNLNGYFDALTMDRWLMRTYGRMTGTLLTIDQEVITAARDKLKDAVSAMTDKQRKAMAELIGAPVRKNMTKAELDALAKAVDKASMKPEKRKPMQASEETNRFRLDARNLYKALDGQKEAPSGPAERNWIRAIFATALDRLRAVGKGMTMSDLQALLWYPERRLYDAAKADESIEEGYEDDDAPDYANAAMKLALDNGADRGTVLKAMDDAEAKGTVRAETFTSAEREKMVREMRAAPDQQIQMSFEVAPDPANEQDMADWSGLDAKERADITKAVRDEVLDGITKATGVELKKVVAATGGFAGLINPNLIGEYQKTKVSLEQARALAAAIGYVLSQDSVALADPRTDKSVELIRLTFDKKPDAYAKQIFEAIRKAVPAIDGFTLRGNNFDILNFTGISNRDIVNQVKEAIDALDIPMEYVGSHGTINSELVEKGSYEGHLEGLRPEYSEGVRRELDGLRDRARQIVADGIDASRSRRTAAAGLAERAAQQAGGRGQPDGDRGGRTGPRRSARGTLEAPERAVAQEELSPLPGAPNVPGFHGPDPRLVSVAQQYAKRNGITLRRQSEYVQVDPERAKRIADAYEAMEHAPSDPRVKEAYSNLIRQTRAQYDALVEAGYKFWFIDLSDKDNQEYVSTPWNAMRDIRANQTMGVFPTDDGFGSGDFDPASNPLLEDTGLTWPNASLSGEPRRVLANDLFRAVHDAFGHGLEGAGFRAQGEENAWQAHVRLFTGSAVGAITSETRGQNSWLNYGPYGESNRTAQVEDTVFADQKTGLMPEWTWTEGRAGDAKFSERSALPESLQSPVYEEGAYGENGAFRTSKTEAKEKAYMARGLVPVPAGGVGEIWVNPDEADFISRHGFGASHLNQSALHAYQVAAAGFDPELLRADFVDELVSNLDLDEGYANDTFDSLAAAARAEFKGNEITIDLSGDSQKRQKAKDWVAKVNDMFPRNPMDGRQRVMMFGPEDMAVFELDDSVTSPGAVEVKWFQAYPLRSGNGTKGMQELQRLAAADGMSLTLYPWDKGRVSQASLIKFYKKLGFEKIRRGGKDMIWQPEGWSVRRSARDIAETPQFKAWFGDSKVVDAEGKPLVVYHGTRFDFSDFDGYEVAGWFSATPDLANERYAFGESDDAGANVMPVYLSIKNPKVLDGDMDNAGADGSPMFEQINNAEYVAELIEQGYDGIVVNEDGRRTYAAFRPEQIKSAIGNNGDFDAGNPDIRMSARRSAASAFDPARIEALRVPDYKSREKLIEMRIDDFLALAEAGEDGTKLKGTTRSLRDGMKFETLPYLLVDGERVDGHEGRHRAKALKAAGYETMPVILRHSSIRWSEQNDPNRFDYKEEWPQALRAQARAADPDFSIPFPVSREQAMEPYGGDIRMSARRQTDTPEFKRWFGDSKVVDQDGDPLVMYTGTSKDVDFDAFKIPKNGVWFTADPAIASSYAKENDSMDIKTTDYRTFTHVNTASRVMPVYLRIENPYQLNAEETEQMRLASNYKRAQGSIFERAKAAGHDGIDLGDGTWVVIKEPQQIKSAIGNNGQFSSKEKRIQYSNRDPLGYYSELARQIERLSTKQAPVGAWKSQIKAMTTKGVKPDEIEWTGVMDFLDAQEGKVSREAILNYLKTNGVQVEEVVLGTREAAEASAENIAREYGYTMAFMNGGEDAVFFQGEESVEFEDLPEEMQSRLTRAFQSDDGSEIENETKYGQYTLPGGRNYREVLLTLPEKSTQWGVYDGDRLVSKHVSRGAARDAANAAGFEYDSIRSPQYKSSHWDQPNVLAHIRVNDRTDADGKRVLFVEELQSDWGQEGKKKGFADKSASISELAKQYDQLNRERRTLEQQIAEGDDADQATQAAVERSVDVNRQMVALSDRMAALRSGVPAAPFVTKTDGWLNLALKRIIAMAVDGGYNKVAFINGEQSADRYDLSKRVESVSVSRDEGGKYLVSAILKGGARKAEPGLDASGVESMIGKELAQKLILGADARYENSDARIAALEAGDRAEYDRLREERKSLPPDSASGIDLKVGGEGMKAFYDKIVPNAVKALLKKVDGGQMEMVRLPTSTEIGTQGERNWRATLDDGTSIVFGREQNARDWIDEQGGGTVTFIGVGQPQPGFTVTDAMREKVSGGQPLFSARNPRVDIYALGNGTSLKSAAGNSGDFDAENPDARYSKRTTGDFGRQYTPEQRQFFENVGRTTDTKTIKQRVAEFRKDIGKKLAQGLADQFVPLKELGGNAYTLARLSKGASGAFEALLHHGKLALKDNVYDADQSGGFVETVGLALGSELEDFMWWIAANRADRLSQEDREHLFTADDIKAGKALATGQMGKDYVLANGQVTRDRAQAYADALQKFDAFNKNVLDMAEQSGLIDGEARKLWDSQFYVPFYRVSEEDGAPVGNKIKGGIVRQRAFKQLKGGAQKLNSDLTANVMQNWAHLIDASAKNRAAKATLESAQALGVAIEASEDVLRQMGKSTGNSKGVVWFLDGGRQRHFLIEDPFLLEAINSLEYAGLRGPLMDALSTAKHWLTIGVTASPAFKVRNLIRDSLQAIAVAELSYNPIKNLAEGIRHTRRDDQVYVSALAAGGLMRFGSSEASQADRVRQLVSRGVPPGTVLDTKGKLMAMYSRYIRPGIDAYQELGDRGEEINRVSLYKQLRDRGIDHAQASLMARDLMDFSMQGTFKTIRFLTQVVPFLNARIQGMYKLGKSANEDPKRFGVVVLAVAAASIALMAAYGDDEDWKKREDWDRDGFWWFKFGGVAFRIPKPFEVGAIASIAERGVELFTNDEFTTKRFLDRVKHIASDNLSLNPIPQALKPMLDVYANKDSFSGRPIESLGMERLQAEYRYTSATSLLARGLSTAMNTVTRNTVGADALSPVQIDSLIRGYTGWLGTTVVGAADWIVRLGADVPERPAPDLWKVASQNFLQELPSGQSKYVTAMYEQLEKIEEAYSTHRALIKSGKTDEARAFASDNKELLQRYRMVESVKKRVTENNRRIREIEQSNLAPQVKKAMIRQLKERNSEIARKVY